MEQCRPFICIIRCEAVIWMRNGETYVYGLGTTLLFGTVPQVHASDSDRSLKDAEVSARLHMELIDGVHRAEQYRGDGTYKAFHLGKPSKGKRFVRDGKLCLDEGKGEADYCEISISDIDIRQQDQVPRHKP